MVVPVRSVPAPPSGGGLTETTRLPPGVGTGNHAWCKTTDCKSMSPVRSVILAVAVRATHATVSKSPNTGTLSNLCYEVGHTGVTSPATFGPLPTISGPDSLKSDTCLGPERSVHVATTTTAVIPAGRSAVTSAYSKLENPEFPVSLLSTSPPSWSLVSPRGAPGPLTTPNLMFKTVVIVGATGVTVNMSWSESADHNATLVGVVVPPGVPMVGTSVLPACDWSGHL